MRNGMKLLGFGILVVFLLAGCSKPTKEMADAKAAIDAVIDEGADIYAKQDLEKLQADLTAAMDAVNAKSKKFFKNYGDAKKMLTEVTMRAEEVRATIPAKKEDAKNAALSAKSEAQVAVEEAKLLLSDAPRGKGTKADIDAFAADLAGLEGMMPEIQAKIDSEDFFGAAESARIVKEKAVEIADQIKQAMEKVKKR